MGHDSKNWAYHLRATFENLYYSPAKPYVYSSLYTDQRSLHGTQAEEEEGVDHNSYLTSHREQESPKEESHGH